MKKILRFTIMTIILSSSIASANEGINSNIFFGSGGYSSSDKSATARIGLLGEHFGAGIGYSFNSDYTSSQVNDYPVSHSNYTNIGKKQIDGKMGLDLYGSINPSYWSKITFGAGTYFYKEAEVARSNSTGWLYEQSSSTKVKFSGSIDGFLIFNNLAVGIGYHSILGFQGSLGYAF